MELKKEQILNLFLKGGGFFEKIEGFEYRKEQIALIEKIIEVFNTNKYLIAEAGTGTGKSLAYVLPSVFLGEKVIISTNTKALQDQLFLKDIPLLEDILEKKISVGLAKGKGNFICLRRQRGYLEDLAKFNSEEIEYLNEMKKGVEGTEKEYEDMPRGLFSKISCDDVCQRKNCSHFEECFYYKNKKKLQAADVIVCNHHLLACDLALRESSENFETSLVLPAANYLVVDEAHNIEDIFIKSFTSSLSKKGLEWIFSRLYSVKSKQGVIAKLHQNSDDLNIDDRQKFNEIVKFFVDDFESRLMAMIYNFNQVADYIKKIGESRFSTKYRVKPSIAKSQRWIIAVVNKLHNIDAELISILTKLEMMGSLVSLKSDNDEKNGFLLLEFEKIRTSIEKFSSLIGRFVDCEADRDVRWIEVFDETNNIKFNITPIDISQHLNNTLYHIFRSVVFTSATLSTNKNFDYISKKLGLTLLEEETRDSIILDSPFDYKKNSSIIIPKISENPNSKDYTKRVSPIIKDFCLELGGKTFVLFTSFSMLTSVFTQIKNDLIRSGITPLSQAEHNKETLVEKFKKMDKSVLFGTSTFWEGVDIRGDQLQCVIIPKLPFMVPSEPIVEAKMEMIEEQGGTSFFDFMLPEAAIKLKQGFGRLIRSKVDRGVVVFLDNRLYSKGYGKQLLNSLPDSPVVVDSFHKCLESFKNFFK